MSTKHKTGGNMAFKSELEARMERELAQKERLHKEQMEAEVKPIYNFEDAIRDWVALYYNAIYPVNVLDDEVEVLNYKLRLEMTLTLMRKYHSLKEQGKLNFGFIEHIREGLEAYCIQDYRDYTEERGFYSLQFLVFVIMFAKLRGKNTATEIVSFYREHYLEFMIIAPDVPPFKYSLSETTIKTAISSLNEQILKDFFSEHFAPYMSKAFPTPDESVKDTYAFDGQAMNSTFRQGEENRRCKGGNVTSLYCCNRKQDLGYELSVKKNQERTDILKIFARTYIRDTVVMCDALNSQSVVTDAVLSAGADYLMPIGQNGNKELLEHITAIFWRQRKDVITYVSPQVQKAHGRIESVQIDILPAMDYVDPRIYNQHQNLRTLVKYVVHRTYVIQGKTTRETAEERYYISSLAFDKENDSTLKQVTSSILSYWQIETHHAVLDDPRLFNQDGLQACSPGTLSNTAGFNKIAHTVLSWFREEFSRQAKLKSKMTFKATMERLESIDMIRSMNMLGQLWAEHNQTSS